MRASVLRSVVIAGIVGVLGAACGGGDGDDTELIAAIASAIDADSSDFEDLNVDSTCVAEALVDSVGGADQADEKYGINVEFVKATPDYEYNLNADDAGSFVDSFWECGDIMEVMAIGMTEEGASDEDSKCLVDNLDEGVVKKAMVGEFTDAQDSATTEAADEAMFESITGAMAACGIDFG